MATFVCIKFISAVVAHFIVLFFGVYVYTAKRHRAAVRPSFGWNNPDQKVISFAFCCCLSADIQINNNWRSQFLIHEVIYFAHYFSVCYLFVDMLFLLIFFLLLMWWSWVSEKVLPPHKICVTNSSLFNKIWKKNLCFHCHIVRIALV